MKHDLQLETLRMFEKIEKLAGAISLIATGRDDIRDLAEIIIKDSTAMADALLEEQLTPA